MPSLIYTNCGNERTYTVVQHVYGVSLLTYIMCAYHIIIIYITSLMENYMISHSEVGNR